MRKFLLPFFLVASIAIWALWPAEQSRVDIKKRAAVNATCKVDEVGTGVLLETGYVLTARHVIGEDVIERTRKNVLLQFYGDAIGDVHTASVHYTSPSIDFSILKVDLTKCGYPHIGVKLSTAIPLVGEDVYTIGASLGEPFSISTGQLGEGDSIGPRTSCYISKGNSGGGVFRLSEQFPSLLGIIKSVRYMLQNHSIWITMPMQQQDGSTMVLITQSFFQSYHFVNAMSYYVPTQDILKDLGKVHLTSLVIQHNAIKFSPMAFCLLKTTLQICLVLLSVYCLRKYIFST